MRAADWPVVWTAGVLIGRGSGVVWVEPRSTFWGPLLFGGCLFVSAVRGNALTRTHTHTYKYIYIHIHTHKNMKIHLDTHKRICTYRHIYTHTVYTRTDTHTHFCTFILHTAVLSCLLK